MGLKDNILAIGWSGVIKVFAIDTGDSVTIDEVVVFFAEVDGTVFSIGTSVRVGV